MHVWQSGRESDLLDDIIRGTKTIEGRLRRGKFAMYQVGDLVHLRRDTRDEYGALHDGHRFEIAVRVVAVRPYRTFLEMIEHEGYERVIPRAKSAHQAASLYDRYYSAEDQAHYGVLAVEIAFVGAASSE